MALLVNAITGRSRTQFIYSARYDQKQFIGRIQFDSPEIELFEGVRKFEDKPKRMWIGNHMGFKHKKGQEAASSSCIKNCLVLSFACFFQTLV
jgi:hypothetical protein